MTKKKLYFVLIVLSILAIVLKVGFSSSSIFGSITAMANGYYLEISAGSPLNENWSPTNRINVDDDWANVVAIEGFTGDNIAPVAGTDARLVVADNPGGTLDVKANLTNPASTLDGVGEFELPNPTIALRASDAATAPNIVIHLNTTIGCVGKGVAVDFNVRDIDNTVRNAQTQVVTQYRIGGSGNYTSINGSYIADATTGPNQAAQVTPRHVTLPLTASGQPMLDIRILTTNTGVDDEWVGIDDIKVDCIHPTSSTAFVSGRVVDSIGNGVSKAQVSILNMQTGETRAVVTSPFGYYSFGELDVTYFYTVTVAHKRYQFPKNNYVFQLMGDMEEVNFVGN